MALMKVKIRQENCLIEESYLDSPTPSRIGILNTYIYEDEDVKGYMYEVVKLGKIQ
jgi:hypothetical protein